MMDYVRFASKQGLFHGERGTQFNENFAQQNAGTMNGDFAVECLRSHNHYRAQHGCPPLHLSLDVSRFSQQWADRMSREDHLHHSHHPRYGENLFVTYLSDNSQPMIRGPEVVESWYSEHKFYPFSGYGTREITSKAGHFSQVIWSSSRELGIGKSVSRSNRVYVVANYYPPGNIANKFPANVPKRISESCGKHYYSNRRITKSVGFRRRFYYDSWIEC